MTEVAANPLELLVIGYTIVLLYVVSFPSRHVSASACIARPSLAAKITSHKLISWPHGGVLVAK